MIKSGIVEAIGVLMAIATRAGVVIGRWGDTRHNLDRQSNCD